MVQELGDQHVEKQKSIQRLSEEKKIGLLTKERNLLKTELEEEVIRQLRSKENALGVDQVGTFLSFNGKQLQLNRVLEEKLRIQSEIAGFESRLGSLTHALEEGRTPAEVDAQIRNSGTYASYKRTVDDFDIELDSLRRNLGDHHETVIAYERRKAAFKMKLDEEREELKSVFTEGMKSELQNAITASNANLSRVDTFVRQISGELGQLNATLNDYRTLQGREHDLREKISRLEDEIRKINQFDMEAKWGSADWSSPPQRPDRPSFPRLSVILPISVMLGFASHRHRLPPRVDRQHRPFAAGHRQGRPPHASGHGAARAG